MRRRVSLVMLLLAACVACRTESPSPPARDAAAQRAADSAVGASELPGAQGVSGALKAADSSAARNAALDSIAKAP